MGAFFPKTPRTIRMGQDLRDMNDLKKDSTIFDFEVQGDPPSKYMITFYGNSLIPGPGGAVVVGGPQKVELSLGPMYPVERPHVEWETPIVHPNISGSSVCLGNYNNAWTPHFRLVDLVEILWDYARMYTLNPEGGYRAHYTTKQWDDMRRHFQFPVDRRLLRDKLSPTEASRLRKNVSEVEEGIEFLPDGGSCETE